MKKYWQMYKTFLQKHLAYRFRVLIWVFVDTMEFFAMPFVWLAVYAGRASLGGYTQAEIITYYLIMIFISLTTSSHIMRIIRTDIMNGDLNSTLLKPINYCIFRFTHELSYKLISGSLALLIFFIAWFVLPKYISLPVSWLNLLLFVLALCLALLISFAFQFMVGFTSFWLGENSGPERVRQLLDLVFSGALAPLVFYPQLLQTIAHYLPFKFLSYFPAQIYLNQIDFKAVFAGFTEGIIWLIFFYFIVWQMWKRGIKKYEGIGL